MGVPERGGLDVSFPLGDGVEVELQEDALAAVLGGGHPGGLAVAGEVDQAGRDVVDAVHLVEAREPEDGIDALHPVDADDALDAGVQFGAALHLGDHESGVVLLFGEQGRLLEVAPFGDEQLDRIPVGAALLAVLLGLRRCEHVCDGGGDVVVGESGDVDVACSSEGADHRDLVSELPDLVDAEFDAEMVGECFLLFGVRARHDNDALRRGEPQVRGTHHDERGLRLAAGKERA